MVPSTTRSGTPAVRSCFLALLLAPPAAADHVRDFERALAGVGAGNPRVAEKPFLDRAGAEGGDQLLALLELGALTQMRGDFARSRGFLDRADRVARAFEGRAVVSGGAALRGVGAVLTGDRVLRYEGAGFEKVLGRTLNAVNYLFLDDLEGALVEVRKAEEYQALERRRLAWEPAAGPGPRPSLEDPRVASANGDMFRTASPLGNSFENAFTYFLSSQLHLLRGAEGLDDARVDIRRAAELAPQVPAVQSAFREIASAEAGGASPGGRGKVVVLFATGLAPRLEEVRLDLPVEGRLYSLALPIYRDPGRPCAPLVLEAGGTAWTTATLQDTRRFAARSLQERLPGMLARSLAGALAKARAQEEARAQGGPLAEFFAKVLTVTATAADRRSWLGLPAEVQVALLDLPAGEQRLNLNAPGISAAVPVNVPAGGRTFLLVRNGPGFHRIDARSLGGPHPAPDSRGVS